jgi:hypothetical protein
MQSRFSIRILLCAAWLLAAAVGVAWMCQYEHTAGNAETTPLHWPSTAAISLDETRDTLVLFAHPKCPCTRATLEELDRLLARGRNKIAAFVFFLQSDELADAWADSDLRKKAAAIPNVTVFNDPQGALAKTFGAQTSGHVVLYSPQGELLFSGGITESRGHSGRNASGIALISRLEREQSSRAETPVYGCSLVDSLCRRVAP